MKINIENIPSERTRKEIEKEYGYYCQLDRKGYGISSDMGIRISRRLNAGRTIGRAINTEAYNKGGVRVNKYDWEGIEINKNTVHSRMRTGRSWEQAISIPVGHKKT